MRYLLWAVLTLVLAISPTLNKPIYAQTHPIFIAYLEDPRTFPQVRVVPYRLALPEIANKPVYRRYIGFGNCVTTVRNAGFQVPRSVDGYARTIPVRSTALPPEGKLVVIKTAESYAGHVLVARRSGDRLIAVVDSVGAGRVIPLSVYRGQI